MRNSYIKSRQSSTKSSLFNFIVTTKNIRTLRILYGLIKVKFTVGIL